MKGKALKILISGLVVALVVGIVMVGKWIESELSGNEPEQKKPVAVVVKNTEAVPKKEYAYNGGPVERQSMLEPNRHYTENIFFADGQEIARYKSKGEEIFALEGEIPDARVTFVDRTNNTYGEENYFSNQRHGEYKEYYKDGNLKREAIYNQGKILKNKIYFSDGVLRQEEDFSDVLWMSENKEKGSGKVYHRDGTIKYEWSITNKGNGGYSKSYNSKGQLVETRFFDELGREKEIRKANYNEEGAGL